MAVKVVEVSPKNIGTWDSPRGMLYKFKYKFDDGVELTAQHKDDAPKFKVGDEVEYEVTNDHKDYGKSGKVTRPQSAGRKITTPFIEIKRMVKSNAIHAMMVVNSTYKKEVITSKDLTKIQEFTLGDIKGDIDKFGVESGLLTSRLAAVNNAAIGSGFKTYNNVTDLITLAEGLYSYIKK